MSNDLAIRSATADDLEAVRVLLRDTWHDTYDPIYDADEVERLTAEWHSIEAMEQRLDRPQAAFLVAEAGGAVVGTAFAALEEEALLWLRQLYVLPSKQRDGVGRRLLDAVLKQFGGVERVLVEVEVANRGAVIFYESQGFETRHRARPRRRRRHGDPDGAHPVAQAGQLIGPSARPAGHVDKSRATSHNVPQLNRIGAMKASTKEWLLQIFTWWNNQTIGTRFHTWRYGQRVGEDEFGNVYYQSEGGKRRWVIYSGPADASAIPPGWHGWMHHRVDTPPSAENYRSRDWQKPHEPNHTGTPLAYRPKGSLLNPAERPRVTGDYDAWTP